MSLDLATLRVGDRIRWRCPQTRHGVLTVLHVEDDAVMVRSDSPDTHPVLILAEHIGDYEPVSLPQLIDLDPEQVYAVDLRYGDIYSLKMNEVPQDEHHARIRITGYEVVTDVDAIDPRLAVRAAKIRGEAGR